jgi:hypothetical protein
MPNDLTPAPRPKVDDNYWFAFSEALISSATEALDKSSAKIESLVVWLWGIYTASAAAGVTLAGYLLPIWAKLVIALPSLLLVIVYFCAVWIQSPVAIEFDPRSPTEIRLAYNKLIKTKRRRSEIGLYVGLVAALSVGVALIAASMTRHAPTSGPSLEVELHRTSHHKYLAVLGGLGGADSLRLTVTASRATLPDEVVSDGYYRAGKDGVLQTSVELDSGFTRGTVSLEGGARLGGLRLSRTIADR